jgi:transcriptional regulator with XRE-family HTH domain
VKTASPADVASRNIELLRNARGLSNGRLAQRMRTVGFSWDRKTVARVLKGQRRIHVDEVYALAICLETTATILIAPIDRGEMARHGQTPDIQVGMLRAVLPSTARGLFSDEPTELLTVPPVTVAWESDKVLPRWKLQDGYGHDEMAHVMASQLDAADVSIPENADAQTVIDLWYSEIGGRE